MSVNWISCSIPLLIVPLDYDNSKAGSSSKSTPKGMNKHKIFAPASPAFSTKAAVLSSDARKPSLRASDTGMALHEKVLIFLDLPILYSPLL